MDKKTFLYQINVTRDCNLRCDHCYIHTDKKVASKFMSMDEFLEIFSKIKEHMSFDSEGSNLYGEAEIHVIGGEPGMLGLGFYQEAIPKARSILSGMDKKVTLKLVTNLLTEDAVEIAKLFDYVATSFEYDSRFPKKKLLERWEDRCRSLAADPSVSFGVTSAITIPVVQKGATALLDYLVDDLGVRQIHLGFFIPSGDGLVNQLLMFPRFEETSAFLIDACDWYWKRKSEFPGLYVNPIESLERSIQEESAADDIVCPIIPGSLDFDWDGNTVTCIEAGGEVDADWIGNVFSQSIVEILSSNKYLKERIKAKSPKRICAGCDEFTVCQGACGVLHKFWSGEGECPGFKRFIKYVREHAE